MDDKNKWDEFSQTGAVKDYLSYKGYNAFQNAKNAEAQTNADQNKGDSPKAPQYR